MLNQDPHWNPRAMDMDIFYHERSALRQLGATHEATHEVTHKATLIDRVVRHS